MAHQTAYLEGHLTKWPISRSFGRPKRRFFVLQDCSLRYFESEDAFVQDQQPLGAIVLSYHYHLSSATDHRHGHVLDSPVPKAQRLCFAADNEEEQEMWVEAIAKVLSVLKIEHETGETYPNRVAGSDLRMSLGPSPLQAELPDLEHSEQHSAYKEAASRDAALAASQKGQTVPSKHGTAATVYTDSATDNQQSLYGDDTAFGTNVEYDDAEDDGDEFGELDIDDSDFQSAITSEQQSLYVTSDKQKPRHRKKMTLAGFFRRRCNCEAKSSPKRIEAIYQLWRRWTITLYAMSCARNGDVDHFRRVVLAHQTRLNLKKLYAVAVHARQLGIIDVLLTDAGVDVNARLLGGSPIFWFAAGMSRTTSDLWLLQALVERGADLGIRNANRQTVMFWACYSLTPTCQAVLEYLKEQEVDVCSVDKLGTTPLHWAARQGHLPTVQWLCYNGGHNHRSASWLSLFDLPYVSRFVTQEDRSARKEWFKRKATKHVEMLTPLGVAIFHRQEFVAKYLMGYKCPTACSYKFDLFEEDNKDLKLVAATWPDLLPDVLDGFVHQTNKEKFGYSGLVYDIKQLFGSSDTAADRTPLAILWAIGKPEIFRHKVIKLIINLKWSLFGRDEYIRQVVAYSVLLLAFVIGFIFRPSWGLAFRCLSWVMCCYLLVREELKEFQAAPSAWAYLSVGWNWLSLVSYGLILGCICFEPFALRDHEDAYRLVVAPAALCLFVRCTEHLAVLRSTGPYVAMIRIMLQVTSRWAILFAWLELTMSVTLFVLLRQEERFDTYGKTLVATFQMSLGEVDRDFSEDPNVNSVATILVLFFVLLIFVLYLNILVAMLNHSYTDLAQEAESAALLARTEALLRMESTMKDSDRAATCAVVNPKKGSRNYVNLRDNVFDAGTEIFISDTQIVVIEVQEEQVKEDVQVQIDSLVRLQSRIEDLEMLQDNVEESVPDIELSYVQLAREVQTLRASLEDARKGHAQLQVAPACPPLFKGPRGVLAVSKGIKQTFKGIFKGGPDKHR